MEHINSWKNIGVFEKQLDLNLKELANQSTYPPHWGAFIFFIKKINPKTILDIGCGCGSYYELCKKEFKDIIYTGADYSKEAIELSIKKWDYTGFIQKDYLSLTKEFISDFDVIHLGGVLDVLPNGDEALEFILSLEAKNIIIGRIRLVNEPSHYKTYTAYDEITTYSYHHNIDNFFYMCNKYNYTVEMADNNAYLKKVQ